MDYFGPGESQRLTEPVAHLERPLASHERSFPMLNLSGVLRLSQHLDGERMGAQFYSFRSHNHPHSDH